MNPGEILQEENLWTTNMNQQRTELAVWRIHRRIGMSGGLLIDALLREIGHRDTKTQAADLAQLHEEAYARRRSQVRVLPGALDLLATLSRAGVPWAAAKRLGVPPNPSLWETASGIC